MALSKSLNVRTLAQWVGYIVQDETITDLEVYKDGVTFAKLVKNVLNCPLDVILHPNSKQKEKNIDNALKNLKTTSFRFTNGKIREYSI